MDALYLFIIRNLSIPKYANFVSVYRCIIYTVDMHTKQGYCECLSQLETWIKIMKSKITGSHVSTHDTVSVLQTLHSDLFTDITMKKRKNVSQCVLPVVFIIKWAWSHHGDTGSGCGVTMVMQGVGVVCHELALSRSMV